MAIKKTTKEEEVKKTPEGEVATVVAKAVEAPKVSKRKVTSGILSIEATFNNTKAVFSDTKGNALFWSSSGTLGFRGTKKGTPFAASKVGELLAEKAENIGVKEVEVVVKGVGSGREPVIRSFLSRGFELLSVKDATPVPWNGPKPKKPRRV